MDYAWKLQSISTVAWKDPSPMPMLSKGPYVTMDGTSQRIKASKPSQPANEKGRRGKGIMEREDNLRFYQGTSTREAAPVSRDKVIVTVNLDPGIRT